MLMILVRSAQRNDPAVVNDILDLATALLSEAKPLSLIDGRSFSPFAAQVIEPLVAFVGSLNSPEAASLSHTVKTKALSVLLGMAIARGSLGNMLAVVQTLLNLEADGKQSAGAGAGADLSGTSKRVTGFLKTLEQYEPNNSWLVAVRTNHGSYLNMESGGTLRQRPAPLDTAGV